jgi:thiosulfate/3-mercaptopyruvate sulfurtransferase
MADPLVSTAWLAERLGAEEIRVVDGSWHMPATGRSGAAEFVEAHIPGAVFFDIDAIADQATDLPHMLPTPEAFAQAVGALGLSRDKTVIAYDSVGLMSAARVWWALRAMGFPQVFVLDGGLPKWRAEGRPLEAGEAQPKPTALEPRFDPAFVRSLEDVRGYLRSGEARLVDARAAARFRGEAPEPRAGLRAGHMPGAANVPFGELLHPDGTVKDAEAVRAAFQSAGVDLEKPIVTTCGSGVTAAILSLGLARLGIEAPVYDGSWTEWGGRGDTEIVTGA